MDLVHRRADDGADRDVPMHAMGARAAPTSVSAMDRAATASERTPASARSMDAAPDNATIAAARLTPRYVFMAIP